MIGVKLACAQVDGGFKIRRRVPGQNTGQIKLAGPPLIARKARTGNLRANDRSARRRGQMRRCRRKIERLRLSPRRLQRSRRKVEVRPKRVGVVSVSGRVDMELRGGFEVNLIQSPREPLQLFLESLVGARAHVKRLPVQHRRVIGRRPVENDLDAVERPRRLRYS